MGIPEAGKAMNPEFTIDAEFQSLIAPLTSQEFELLIIRWFLLCVSQLGSRLDIGGRLHLAGVAVHLGVRLDATAAIHCHNFVFADERLRHRCGLVPTHRYSSLTNLANA
jgi:hypothetical protein